MAAEAPIFVAGTGRCGTTVLTYVLNAHPNVFCLRHEARFIVHPGGLLDLLAAQDRESALRFFGAALLGDWYRKAFAGTTGNGYVGGLWRDVDRGHLSAVLHRFEATYIAAADRAGRLGAVRRFVAELYRPNLEKTGKRRFAEKTPANILFMADLQELFPDAKVVHIIRDGRDVCASIVENFWPIDPRYLIPGDREVQPWSIRWILDRFRGGTTRHVDEEILRLRRPDSWTAPPLRRTVRHAASFWRDFLVHGRRQGDRLTPGTYHEVRLEDLVQKPEETLESLCRFIGEEPDERMLRPLSGQKANICRWRGAFSSSDLKLFNREAGQLLHALGYE